MSLHSDPYVKGLEEQNEHLQAKLAETEKTLEAALKKVKEYDRLCYPVKGPKQELKPQPGLFKRIKNHISKNKESYVFYSLSGVLSIMILVPIVFAIINSMEQSDQWKKARKEAPENPTQQQLDVAGDLIRTYNTDTFEYKFATIIRQNAAKKSLDKLKNAEAK